MEPTLIRSCSHEHAAAPGCDLLDREQWKQANPGLASGIKSTSYMEAAAARASATPASESSFRALDLNQPASIERHPILGVSDWVAIESRDVPQRGGRCTLGLDLGGSSAMTSACALWENGAHGGMGSIPFEARPPAARPHRWSRRPLREIISGG